MQRMVTRNYLPLPRMTTMTRILVMLKLWKIQAKNPEKKGWDIKGKWKCYPGKLHQEDL